MLGYILNVNPGGEKQLGFGYRVDPELFRLITASGEGDKTRVPGAVCFKYFEWFQIEMKARGIWPRIANLVGPDIIKLGKRYADYARMPVCIYPSRELYTVPWSVAQAMPENARERERIAARIYKIDTDQHEQFHAAVKSIDEQEYAWRVTADDRARGMGEFPHVDPAFVRHFASQVADVLVEWQKKRGAKRRSHAAIRAKVLRFLFDAKRASSWSGIPPASPNIADREERLAEMSRIRSLRVGRIPEEWMARVEGYNAARVEAARMKNPAADYPLAVMRKAYGGDLFRAFVEALDSAGLTARTFYRRTVQTFVEPRRREVYAMCGNLKIGDRVSYDPAKVGRIRSNQTALVPTRAIANAEVLSVYNYAFDTSRRDRADSCGATISIGIGERGWVEDSDSRSGAIAMVPTKALTKL